MELNPLKIEDPPENEIELLWYFVLVFLHWLKDPLHLIIFLVSVALIAGIAAGPLLSFIKARRRLEVWNDLAERLGLELRNDLKPRTLSIIGMHRGFSAELEKADLYSREEGHSHLTTVTAVLQRSIHPSPDIVARVLIEERPADRRKVTGDPAFDEVFAVLGRDSYHARDLLNPALRRALLDLAQLEGQVRFDGQRLVVSMEGWVVDEAHLERLLQAATDCARALEEARAGLLPSHG